MRRTGAALEVELADSLEVALRAIGVVATRREARSGPGRRPDLLFDIDGRSVVVEVKSVVSEPDVPRLLAHIRRHGGSGLVAAERIAAGAKERFIEAGVGFLDRRGRLRLVVPGALFVDMPIAPGRSRPAAGGPLGSEVSKEVAIVLLSDFEDPLGVRQLAYRIDRAPSSVFEALKRLREAGLVTVANEPVIPDLFWELAANWKREAHGVAALPAPGSVRGERWVLTDAPAAVAWGIPIDVAPDHPPDFYVPSANALHHAMAAFGPATTPGETACTLRVAPARVACRRWVSRPTSDWPVADHIVVALDVAQDRVAGRRALARWHPRGIVRVW